MKYIFFAALALIGGLLFTNQQPSASEQFETTFYKSGKVDCKTPYKNGLLEGTKTCFYESGIRKTETVYKNNIERLYTWFAPDGLPLMSVEYDANHKIVQSKTWYSSGELKNITNYRNDVRHGQFIEYHTDGKIKSEIIYENDKPVRR